MSEIKNIWDKIYSSTYLTIMPKEDAISKNLIHYDGYKNYVVVPEIVTKENGIFVAQPLTKEDAKENNLEYSEYRIKRAAEINMENQRPPMLLTLEDYLLQPSYTKDLFSNPKNELKDAQNPGFLILTNRENFHGASALLEEHVIDRIHEILNAGFAAVIADEDFCYIVAESILKNSMNKLGKTMEDIEEEISLHDNMFWFPINSTIHDGKYYTTYKMTDEEIKDHPYIGKDGEAAFYRFILKKACGVDYDEISSCSCSEIDVAKNIQDHWFNSEHERIINEHIAKHGYEPSEGTMKEAQTQFAMLLALNGPKAMEDLPDNTVRFSETFITA